jgi:uncharacterized protein YbaP (TraB family)
VISNAGRLGVRFSVFLVFAALVAACDKPAQTPASPTRAESGSDAGSGVKTRVIDVAEPEPELPDADMTKALADQACPLVKAPFFFRIEKAGKVSYMLGTRHMSVSLDKMPARVKAELSKASLVVFETPPGDDAEDPPGDGKSLADKLGPEVWAKYKRLVGPAMASMVEHQSPSTAMVALMMVFENQGALLDVEIERFVAVANIATAGLETSAFQAKLLAELLDLKMLRATINGTPNRAALKREAVEDISEYCAGTDEDPGMDARTKKVLLAGGYTDAEIAALDDKLLDQRNRAWMPKLDEMFSRGGVFVVVGADHLTGKRGVISMLGQRGFATARLR